VVPSSLHYFQNASNSALFCPLIHVFTPLTVKADRFSIRCLIIVFSRIPFCQWMLPCIAVWTLRLFGEK